MTLLDATANSINTIFAQVVLDVGPENVVDMMHKLGIRSKLEPVCSITLGTQAVTPLEMTDAYATLAARGVHHNPQAIVSIKDASGNVVFKSKGKGNRAIPENDADLVTYALQGVITHGTGTAAALPGVRPAAGKTGTNQEFRDAWFCGYTPQLATCVWVGYKKGELPMRDVEGVPEVFGGTIPAAIWHDFMTTAMEGQPVETFPTPDFSQNTVIPDHAHTLPPPPPSPAPSPTPSPHPTKKCPFPNPDKCKKNGGNGPNGAAVFVLPLVGTAALTGIVRRRRRGRRGPRAARG
jgi:penicillin-binding protein 1A